MLKILFEDDNLMVFDKPSGLVVTSSETNKVPALEDILKKDFGINIERGGIVHRLDKDTSGILVVAKTVEALESLQAQFKSREVKKEYLALVHGFVEGKGKVDAPIIRNPRDREKFIVAKQELETQIFKSGREFIVRSQALPGEAREAVTGYEPIANFQFSINNFQEAFEGFNKIQLRKLERSKYGNFTLLKCHPLTGRTHQIRVHLKYIGFPIVADEKYGGRKTARLDHRWCPRQFLHAAKLEINHPVTGKRMVFESPLPDDLREALEKLEQIKNGTF